MQIKNILNKINSGEGDKEFWAFNANPVNYYLTELVLGANWKYHTELNLFDGSRPPFHDPVLGMASKILFPFQLFGVGTKLPNSVQPYAPELYKKLYPNNPVKFDCVCGAYIHI